MFLEKWGVFLVFFRWFWSQNLWKWQKLISLQFIFILTLDNADFRGMAFQRSVSQLVVLEQFAHTDLQTILSQRSKLAPTSARAEAHDVQADDVRFWATSCTDGPVPELGDAVFVSQVKRAAFAEEIRAYMERDTH